MKGFTGLLLLSVIFLQTAAISNIDLDAPNPDKKWITISGAPVGSYSGRTVSNIGDFNGDGIDDLLVNSPNMATTEVVYVIYGQKDGFSQDTISVAAPYSEGFLIKGPFINGISTAFGAALSKAIDLNGDGLADIVISAPGFSSSQGIVYVIYGKKGHTGDIIINQDLTFSSVQGFVILGPLLSQFGSSISSAGDFNGDGYDDLLIGASNAENYLGAVFVIYGKKGNYQNIFLNETQQGLKIVSSLANNCKLGSSVDGAGDINGDGIDDILLGVPSCACVYGLYGKRNRAESVLTMDFPMDASKGFRISAGSMTSQFGNMVSSAGDFNGDGVGDIIIGTNIASGLKGAFVFYGRRENWPSFDIGNGLALDKGFMIVDSRSTILSLGVPVYGGGDINGDGIADILVRARTRINLVLGGYVAVIYGNPVAYSGALDIATDLTEDKGFAISGSGLNVGAVWTSISMGNLNGDHFDDVIIGAPQANSFSGKAYVIFGANGCPKNCSTCQASKCLTCFKGSGLYDGACGECPTGTYLSDQGICQECSDNCVQCKSSTKCQVCAEGYTLSDSKMCISGSQAAQAAVSTGLFDGASAISNSLALGSSVPTNFGLVSKILRNTKYLNISVSKELQETFNAWKISTGIFPAPEYSDSQGSLPLVFERYEMKSAFLFNYWKSVTMILIGFGCFILSKGAETAFSKNNSIKKITRTVNIIASNFMLTQFYGSIDDILFYFVIDLRSSESTSSGFRTFGFLLGLVFLVAGLVITGFHGTILFKYQRLKKKGGSAQADFMLHFLKKYENIKLFYQDFKDVDVFQQAFLLINITRSLLSSLIFTMLFYYPLLQILLLVAFNICILVYLFLKKPFKDSVNAYAQYFCESILLIAYLSILVLAFKDEADSEASKAIKGFSMVVIISNMALLVGSAVFMLVNIGIILYEIYKERRRLKSSANTLRKDGISIQTFSSRPDSSYQRDNMTIENSLMPPSHNMIFDYSNTNNGNFTQNEFFQNNSSSPNIGPRRKIRKGTFQRSTQSPVLRPSIFDNRLHYLPGVTINPSPVGLQVERGDSSFMRLNTQNSFLLNPEGLQDESVLYQNSEAAQFDVGTRNRAISVPMEPLNIAATRGRSGTTTVMMGGELQFGSKKTRIKKVRR